MNFWISIFRFSASCNGIGISWRSNVKWISLFVAQ